MRFLLFICILLSALPSAAAWFNGDWAYRQKLTVDQGQVLADLTDFPVFLDTDEMASGFYTNANGDCADVRITLSDGTTEIPREIVFCDGTNGEIHFKASGTLSSTTDTDFYIYYGNDAVSDYATSATYGAENVWTDYVSVWHLQEAVNTSAGGYADSAGANPGTGVSMALTALQGKLSGKAQDFDGASDYIEVADSASLDTVSNQVTMSFWGNADAYVNSSYGIDKNNLWTTILRNTSKTSFFGKNLDTTNFDSTGTTSPGAWNYHASTYDKDGGANNARIYINGGLDSSATRANALGTDNVVLRIGMYSASVSSTFGWDGGLDEVRVANTQLSTAWISTEYNNQDSPSTFYTASAEEEAPASAEEPILFLWDLF